MELNVSQTTTDHPPPPVDSVQSVIANNRIFYEIVNEVGLGTLVAVFGLPANVINLIIFYQHGLKKSNNLVLFGLSLSDLGCLVCLLWFGICKNPLSSELIRVTPGVCYLTGGWSRGYFSRVTGCITAYIAAGRCLCITYPLRFRQMPSCLKTVIVLLFIYTLCAVLIIPEYSIAYIGWKFNTSKNQSYIDLYLKENWSQLERLAYIINAVFGLTIFLALTCFTVLLVVSLQRNSNVRRSITSNLELSVAIDQKRKKTTKMITLIALMLILTNATGVAIGITSFVEPRFTVRAEFSDFLLTAWTFGNLLESINSAVTIAIYYVMSSKFKSTFNEIILRRKQVKIKEEINIIST
ncbi:uncharacterized protein LOC131948621 [Physella acuta]|uniref:uncharacterized protein LOC131948621 n=1 Tax=Physella acuta TaxID=109671 RepID=UPI0027DB6547|nr:uncharacterized protein LOC131948621 [Physella acuta]